MSKNRPVIIDFVGSAGAGKTYLKNNLMKNLSTECQCIDLSETKVTLKDYCIFILFAPRTLLSSLMLLFWDVPRSYLLMYRGLKKWIAFQILLKRASSLKCDFAIFDEGVIQMLGNIINRKTLRRTPFEKIPMKIKKNFLYSDITVFVTADADLSEKRREERDIARRGKFRSKGTKNYISRRLKILREDAVTAQKEGLLKVIFYANKNEFDLSLLEEIKDERLRNNQFQKREIPFFIPLNLTGTKP